MYGLGLCRWKEKKTLQTRWKCGRRALVPLDKCTRYFTLLHKTACPKQSQVFFLKLFPSQTFWRRKFPALGWVQSGTPYNLRAKKATSTFYAGKLAFKSQLSIFSACSSNLHQNRMMITTFIGKVQLSTISIQCYWITQESLHSGLMHSNFLLQYYFNLFGLWMFPSLLGNLFINRRLVLLVSVNIFCRCRQ